MCDRAGRVKVPWPTRPLILPYPAREFVPGLVPDGAVSDDALGEFGLLPVGVGGGRGCSVSTGIGEDCGRQNITVTQATHATAVHSMGLLHRPTLHGPG